MKYASYSPDEEQKPIYQENSLQKNVAKSFGYMALGLGISAVVAFLFSWLFGTLQHNLGTSESASDTIAVVYLTCLMVSFVGLLVDEVILHVVVGRNKHSAWVPYILYAVFMGVFLSSFIAFGLDPLTAAEAFALTSVSFVLMFLIGYFSKANLNVLGMVLSLTAWMILLFGSFWGLMIALTGNGFAYYQYEIIMSVVILVITVLVTAVDSYNIKRILANADGMKNACLYCAYVMYGDYLMILIRVLYLLALGNSRRR